MTTSNSTNFNQTRNEIIKDAMLEIGWIGAEEDPSPEHFALATRVLNRMIKAWQGAGVRLWLRDQAIVFLNADQQSYDLTTTGDHSCLASDFVETVTVGAINSGVSLLTLVSTSGIIVGDYIGIELIDGTRQWTTVATVPDSTTLTIVTPLTSSTADAATVYSYTTRLDKPMKVLDCRRVDSFGNEKVMFSKGYLQYMSIVTKYTSGDPSVFNYAPELTSGTLYIWTTSSGVVPYLKATVGVQIQDFDNAGDNADFPTEWLDAIILNLAAKLLRPLHLASDPELVRDAMIAFNKAMSFDEEDDPVCFFPSTEY